MWLFTSYLFILSISVKDTYSWTYIDLDSMVLYFNFVNSHLIQHFKKTPTSNKIER